jgi:hypothetical protein
MASKNEFVFDWHTIYDPNRKADVFHVDYGSHNPIVTITFNDHSVGIFCDGVMRIVYNNPDGGPVDVVKQSGKLPDIGINNDADYANALYNELYEFDNQPWFDAYSYTYDADGGESLDMVEGFLDDIILEVMRHLLQYRIIP